MIKPMPLRDALDMREEPGSLYPTVADAPEEYFQSESELRLADIYHTTSAIHAFEGIPKYIDK